MTTAGYSGGCQCGAVRFSVVGTPKDTSICHCRMCQKAFGGYYAPLVSAGDAAVEWTRGQPKYFRSSNFVLRGFCADCGTPLSYEAPDGVALAAGAFDEPSLLPPIRQFGIEGKMPFADTLHLLPGHRTEEDAEEAPFVLELISFQHPDHDTTVWPMEQPS